MTLTQSHVSELLDAIRAGGDSDVIRKGVELVLQALIDVEAAEAIGADRYQRAESRRTWRNGNRERLLTTKAGDQHVLLPPPHVAGRQTRRAATLSGPGRARQDPSTIRTWWSRCSREWSSTAETLELWC